ncbi:MAG: DUF4124 domain-containing protein [Azoarcus sp.]|jgi:hypothetical protein|nr:DUF4124 domain-containing protein [Azoarcus sp.]
MKHTFSSTLASTFVLALVMTFALPASAQIYQWKDKDGKVHFSDAPPPDIKIEVNAKPGATPSPATDAADEAASPEIATPQKSLAERELEFKQARAEKAEAEAKAKQEAADAQRRARECERARTQLNALTNGQRMVRLGATGEREFLDDKMRAEEIARAQGVVEQMCK